MIKPKFKVKFIRFDSEAVIRRVEPAKRKFLGWAAALTRKIARRSLKPARQKRLSEMTDDEKKSYEKRVQFAEDRNLPKPRRPEVSAERGNPPKLHGAKSPLKSLLFFGLDLKTESAVIGPEKANSGIADKLEKTHPFMSKALDTVRPQLPEKWNNLVSS